MSQTLAELLVAVGIDTEDLTSGVSGAADEVESTLGGIQGAAAGAAVGGLFVAGLDNAMDASAANAKLARQLGLSAPEAQRAGKDAGAVFSAGFGESIDEVNESIQAVVSSMGGMSKVSDSELKSMSTSALMLADTFEFDVADSAAAAGQMINSGLAKNGKEAFDVLTVAAQSLPKAMLEDIPATVTEYGKSWSRIGLDAKDAFGLMSQYVDAGGRDIDQAGDVLHEFARITHESTGQAAAAFKGLSLDSKKMLADIHKGGAPAKAALDDTLKALRDIGPGAKQSALAVQLFGDMAGEGGDALWAMDPATSAATSGMDHVAGAAAAANAAMAASPGQAFDSIWRTMATTIGDQLAPALKVFADFMKDNPGLVKILAPLILILAGALGIAAIAQWAMNSAMLANPVFWIIAGIIAVVAVIVIIAAKTTWFQQLWTVVWGAIKTAALAVWAFLQAAFMKYIDFYLTLWRVVSGALMAAWNATWNGIKKVFTTVMDAIKAVVSKVWGWIKSYIGIQVTAVRTAISKLSAIAGQVAGYFQHMKDLAVGKVSALISYVRGIGGKVRGAIGNLGGLLRGVGRSIIQGLINGVTGMIGSLRNRFSSITSMIPDWKGPMTLDLKLLTPSGQAVMGGFMDGIDAEVPALHKQLGDITSEIPANVNMSTSRASSTAGGAAAPARVVIDVTGGDDDMRNMIRKMVRTGGGNVQVAFGR